MIIISTAIPRSKLKLFADDTNLFMSGIDKSELCTNCNISLKFLNRWLVANRLSMNLDKTNIMVLPSNKKEGISVSLNVSSVNKVSSCRYLGLYIDDDLNWKTHIEYIYNKLIKFMDIFYKLRNKLPSRIAIHLLCIHSSPFASRNWNVC